VLNLSWTLIALFRASSRQFDDDLNQFELAPLFGIGFFCRKTDWAFDLVCQGRQYFGYQNPDSSNADTQLWFSTHCVRRRPVQLKEIMSAQRAGSAHLGWL
jgi:hypothetical protein